jgi:GntR family transcriptional regulator, trigonelline degradation regulator
MDAAERPVRRSGGMEMRIEPVTVQAQTVSKLRNAILGGVFRPGERLVETDLCQRMGVSRTSMREALRRLEAERLITITPNRGPSVAEISWEEARQIYAVRALLEGEAAALFSSRATAGELARLGAALRDFRAAVAADDHLGRLAATERFYEVILEGCANKIIAEILNGLVARVTYLRAQSMSRQGRSSVSAEEMRAMLLAIKSGKPAQARRAAIRHVRAACAAAKCVYSEHVDEDGGCPPRRSRNRALPKRGNAAVEIRGSSRRRSSRG